MTSTYRRSRLPRLFLGLACVVAPLGCGKSDRGGKQKPATEAQDAARPPKSKKDHIVENILALEAIVEKYERMLNEADAGPLPEDEAKLRDKLFAAKGALEKLKAELAAMERSR